ncbi:hypothetical protein, partial [Halomonas sp. BC04]|uniref:hypothetical protein n=1 Tax=Halomonas sp. BC04 TaxID=1403540 RepID=UPI0012DF80DA
MAERTVEPGDLNAAHLPSAEADGQIPTARLVARRVEKAEYLVVPIVEDFREEARQYPPQPDRQPADFAADGAVPEVGLRIGVVTHRLAAVAPQGGHADRQDQPP